MICKCGKEFTPKNKYYVATERYCSRHCNGIYNPFNRHAWLFNKPDLKQNVV